MGGKKNTGKSPKGRAGAKQKAQKGTPNGGWASSFVRNSDLSRQIVDDGYDDEPFKFFRGFAQGNQGNLPPRNPALKFRHQPITFVSAGSNTPVESELENKLKLSEEAIFVAAEDSEEENEEEDDEVECEFDGSNIQTNIIAGTGVKISEGASARMNIQSTAEEEKDDMSSDIDMTGANENIRAISPEAYPFVVDTVGDPSLVSGFRVNGMQSMRRDPSPAGSDSSEEVVVFHGRSKAYALNSNLGAASKQPRPQQRSQRAYPPQESTTGNTTPPSTTYTSISTLNAQITVNDAINTHPGKQFSHQQRPQVHHGFSTGQKGPNTSWRPAPAEAKGWATSTSKMDAEVNPEAIWAPAPSQPFWKKAKSGKPRPDLNQSLAEMKALENTATGQSKVALAPPQIDGPADDCIDSETTKKIERLAKITRVQAKDDASPPTSLKKQVKMETRIGNIARLESELSPEHVQLARRMGAEEAVRLEQAAQEREKEKSGRRQERETKKAERQQVTFDAHSSSTSGEMISLDETPEKPSNGLVAYPQSDDSDAEETIASLQADVKAVLRGKEKAKESLRELDDDKILLQSAKPKRRRKRGRRKNNRELRGPIVSDDDDLGEEAAYDDYVANLAAQIDGNVSNVDGGQIFTALAGPSLVIDGKEIDDDEVIEDGEEDEEEEDYAAGVMWDDDTSSASSGPIGQDRSDISDMDSSELEDELEYTEREQWEDEEDLRRRRQEQMTDEQIARILAKQEELGIHGDEMILENGEYGDARDGMDGVGDITAARAGLANIGQFSFGRPSNKHGMRRRSNRGNFNFPDASALADSIEQYGENGFDIMDFDRPSLRPKKKGMRGQLPPELEALSDEELKGNMANAWDNDRAKKRLKKAERKELRAQGLLGLTGKKGKADLSQKYQFGMSTEQIHDELRTFLQDDGQNSRPFPPMNKQDRKALHELANALNLNSKSVGTGNDRFPVLFKRSRTPAYTPEVFDKAVSASVNGWLDRDKKFGKKLARKAAKAPQGGIGGGVAAATVRNGEVVGAGAAEIGEENFGHKLMEKMGWSRGMALGKEGEGRLLPVEQVMRAGKGGLGDSSW